MREFLEKYGLRLLIITTVCAVLISVLSFVSATSGFLQNAVGVLTYPFRSAVTAVATWAEDKQRYYKDYSDLIAENEALRAVQELALSLPLLIVCHPVLAFLHRKFTL